MVKIALGEENCVWKSWRNEEMCSVPYIWLK